MDYLSQEHYRIQNYSADCRCDTNYFSSPERAYAELEKRLRLNAPALLILSSQQIKRRLSTTAQIRAEGLSSEISVPPSQALFPLVPWLALSGHPSFAALSATVRIQVDKSKLA